MPRYTDDSKERVRDAVDMVALVGAKTDLRKAGPASYQGLCPFHDERTPSFGIDPVKKVYHCFGCGAGGDAFTFVEETEGLDFAGALEFLADRFGVQLEVADEDPQAAQRRARRERLLTLLDRTAAFYARVLWDADEAAGARAYLLDRGLDEPALRAFRVGYSPKAWDTVLMASRRAGFSEDELLAAGLAQRSRDRPGQIFDRFRGRIMFPLTDLRGRTLGFGARALRDDQQPKYLNSSDGEVYHKGRQLFGADLARGAAAKAGRVVVVEGYTDVLALHQAGIENVVGLMGTAMTEEQVAALARLSGVDGVVDLALDADAAGQEAMLRAARVARGQRLELRVVPLPPGTDPAELVTVEGADAVRSRMAGSVPFARFRVDTILARDDLGTPEGRDRAYAELRGVLSALPPAPSRDELVRRVASRLGLSEQLVALLVQAPGRGEAPVAARPAGADGGASRPAPPPRRAPDVLDKRQQTERTFLALCIAMPDLGRDALRRVDLERHFTSPVARRAAAHLREHLASPTEGLPEGDPELSELVVELAVRAGQGPFEATALELETLQLELARLEREIAAARAEGRPGVAALAAERTAVQAKVDVAVDEVSTRPPREP